MSQKRPIYVVQQKTGVMVPDPDNGELVEAVIVIDYKQSKVRADQVSARHVGSEVVKGFITS